MNKGELSTISTEIKAIRHELTVLDDANSFESRRIDWLLARLDYLDASLASALDANKRRRFTLVGRAEISAVG